MSANTKGIILKGFETGEFRKAVIAYLKEKCPEEIRGQDDILVSFGLQVIKKFIQARKSGAADLAPALA